MIARLPKIKPFFFRRAWHTARLFLSEPYQRLFDKGKPVERRGRKAMDLKSPSGDHDCQVAEYSRKGVNHPETSGQWLSAFIERRSRMTLNHRKTHILFNLGILFLLVGSVLMQPVSAYALGGAEGTNTLPNFSEFSNSVQNGRADHVRGVYVPNVFALPVTQQPSGNAGFVSSEAD